MFLKDDFLFKVIFRIVRFSRVGTLYCIAIKAGLYRKAVQEYHIPITIAFSV